jgi:type III secretion protein S
MDPLMAIGREAIILVLLVSAPPLAASFALGLATGLLQAATQVQEQTLGVVPRLAAVLGALALAAPWIGAHLERFAATCLILACGSWP